MATFDPAAATAAYLGSLTAAEHAKAIAYTRGGYWLLLWGTLVSVAISLVMLKSGVLTRLRARVEGQKPRPILAVTAVVLLAGVIEFVLGLPWSAYSDWWREHQYGLSSQPFGGWFGEAVLALGISLVLTLVLLQLLYALMRRAPKTWWLWSGGVVAAAFMVMLVLAPVLILPLFNTYTPAPPGPVREAVVQMAKANGVPSDQIFIYDGSRQSNRYTANVAGVPGLARISMSDVMFKKDADVAEVRAVVGHEMGHYVLWHSVRRAAAMGALALGFFFLIDRLYPRVLAMTGAPGVGPISDPAGYPILALLLAVLSLLATPLLNTITRSAEAEADSFSLEKVNEPDGLAKALVKTIEYRAASPSALEEAIFYSHPSVGSRVRKAMEWKAKHPAKAG